MVAKDPSKPQSFGQRQGTLDDGRGPPEGREAGGIACRGNEENLQQGGEGKGPVEEVGVGNDEAGLIGCFALGPENVDVQSPGPPPLPPLAPRGALDGVDHGQELGQRRTGPEPEGRVQVMRLGRAHRFGLEDSRRGLDAVGSAVEGPMGALEMTKAISKVAAEAEDDDSPVHLKVRARATGRPSADQRTMPPTRW